MSEKIYPQSISKTTSEEEMKVIRRDGEMIVCRDGHIMITAYKYNGMLYIDDVIKETK